MPPFLHLPMGAAESAVLLDARGRRIRYLRVSLTDRCNFRCRYCMPAEGVPLVHRERMLRIEELAAAVEVLVEDLGLTKVRVTGGEPLVRRGAIEFLRAVGRLPGIADLALTTNGYLLDEVSGDLRRAGVRRLNISLDTLDARRFESLTGVDGLARVLRGIDAAQAAGFDSIKLNAVMLRSNLEESATLLRFGLARRIQVRFIELMPSRCILEDEFVSEQEVREALSREFILLPLDGGSASRSPFASDRDRRPEAPEAESQGEASGSAVRLSRVAGHDTLCGFISPITRPFCGRCDRLRLRGDGRLVPCLASAELHDLTPYLRPDFRRRELAAYIRRVIGASKARSPEERRIRPMWQIGG